MSLGGARTDALLDRVAGALPSARVAVDGFWGPDWGGDGPVTVVAAGSQADFLTRAGLDPARQWTDIAAVAVADSVDPPRGLATGQRIVLAPGAAAMSDAALRIVLTHELFHLAARPKTAIDAPRWLTEGVADYVARPPSPLPAAAAADPTLPSDAELDVPGDRRSAGYDRAWWFARFVADEYGVDGLRRLYRAACGPDRRDFDTAAREALRVDAAGLQARWADWLSHGPASTR